MPVRQEAASSWNVSTDCSLMSQ